MRGRFAQSKGNRSGHVGEEAVKRYLFTHFTLGESLSSAYTTQQVLLCLVVLLLAVRPRVSRVVEAICIRLW